MSLAEARDAGGYAALKKARRMTPLEVQAEVEASKLRGRGGAGFPTGVKWRAVPMGPDAPRPKYLIANADEMEPGTFKDRYLLEGDPHLLLEGMMIAAHAIEANVAWIFLRQEYSLARVRLARAIEEASAAGLFGDVEVHLHISAGRYMCGEETGLLNALEGKRATPRAKPPYPQVVGLFGKPTVVNNVETLCSVPGIIERGAAWFRGLSRTEDGGTKLYGVSGRVKRPGLWELPLGTSAREVIFEHAGGMQDGLTLRAVLPGGASTPFLTLEHLDVPLDFTFPQQVNSRLGTACLIALDDRTCPVAMLENLERFFARESCGFCTPCRDGLPWTVQVLRAIDEGRGEPADLARLALHAKFLGPGYTYCALAPGAMSPLESGLTHFREDFERHLREHGCPYRRRSAA